MPLELNRRRIADAAVPAPPVALACDEFEDLPVDFSMRAERAAIDQLALQGGVEALGHGVVVGITHGSRRGADAQALAAPAELGRGVLSALIGVVDDPARIVLGAGRVLRGQHQLGVERSPQGPTDEDDWQIQESSPGRHRGGIGDPELVGVVDSEVTQHQVGGNEGVGTSHGGAHPVPSCASNGAQPRQFLVPSRGWSAPRVQAAQPTPRSIGRCGAVQQFCIDTLQSMRLGS